VKGYHSRSLDAVHDEQRLPVVSHPAQAFQVCAETRGVPHRRHSHQAGPLVDVLRHADRIHAERPVEGHNPDLQAALAQGQPRKGIVPVLVGGQDHIVARGPRQTRCRKAQAHSRAGDQRIILGPSPQQAGQEPPHGRSDGGLALGRVRRQGEVLIQSLPNPGVEGRLRRVVQEHGIPGDREQVAKAGQVHGELPTVTHRKAASRPEVTRPSR